MMIKGYITNLGKYNEGVLIGEWIEFPINEEELTEVFERIGINEQYEEFFFTDWECDVELNLGEYVSIKYVNELCETLELWYDDTLKAACEVWLIEEVLKMNPHNVLLYCDIKDDYDLGYYWMIEEGIYDIPDYLQNYIDYESFGRDIRFESNGDHTTYGWVEYLG